MKTITQQIEEIAFQLLSTSTEGIRWSELNTTITRLKPEFHPKTINGTLWRLPQKYPEKILKEKGVFRLIDKT